MFLIYIDSTSSVAGLHEKSATVRRSPVKQDKEDRDSRFTVTGIITRAGEAEVACGSSSRLPTDSERPSPCLVWLF